jgi:hypothetical protein
MNKPEFPQPQLIRDDFMPEQDPMKNYRIKKETFYYNGEEFVRYFAQKKVFGIWVDIRRNWSNLLDSYFHIEYCGSFAAANNTIWEHHNSKIKVKNKVEYLEPQPLGPTGPIGHIGPVGSYVNHNIEVK